MKIEQVLILLLAPVGLLLIAGGAAFEHFQHWAVTSSYASAQSRVPASNPFQAVIESNHAVMPRHGEPLESWHTKVQTEVQTEKVAEQVTSPVIVQSFRAPPEDVVSRSPHPELVGAITPPVMLNDEPSLDGVNSAMGLQEFDQVESYVSRTQPVLVAYENEWIVEFPKQLASEQNVKRALSRILLSENPLQEQDLLSITPFDASKRPALYRRVLNNQNQPIRYPREAFRYAEYLMNSHAEVVKDNDEEFLRLTIPLKHSNLKDPARQYESWVLEFSDHFNVPPALVFAVIEVESAFNPYAVSRSQAKGLMQIKPNAAGRDVYQYIDFKLGAPDDKELFDAQSNIRLGTAYLGLLKHDYLAGIRHPESRELVAISSYNGGMSTVLRLFGDGPEQSIARINKLNPRQVYRKLRYEHESDETRRYLDKVLQAKARYQQLLGEDARLLASR